MKAVVIASAASVLVAGTSAAQPVLRVQGDLFASGNDQVGLTDQDSFDVGLPLRQGASISRSVSIQEPGQLSISSSVDFSVDAVRIIDGPFTAADRPDRFVYEVDVSARLFRTNPEFYANGVSAQSVLDVSFDFGDPNSPDDIFNRGLPVSASGQASYTTDQFQGPFNPPIFQIEGQQPGFPLVSMIADAPTGGVQFSDVDLTNQGIGLVQISAMSDVTDILIEHIGTTEVEYNVTLLILGPIPAPSTAALLGLVGLASSRRRR